MATRDILHCDINNFFASVEIILNPQLVGKAVAVCGDPEKRHGIVLAKSNLAKKCGIKTGDAVWEAKQKCPDLQVVPPTYHEYVKYSKEVKKIYGTFTDRVESFGLDECWLDVTESRKLFGSPEEIAYKIKETVKKKTGLTISVGVSFSKVLAKLGSDLKKPDAVTVVSKENYKQVAWPLNVEEMLFVGRATKSKLNSFGIYTIGDLARGNLEFLRKAFGKMGDKLFAYANGIDEEPVSLASNVRIPESVGNGTTTSVDVTCLEDATSVIYSLTEMIAFRLRGYGLKATTVSLNVRDVNLCSFSRQSKLDFATASAKNIADLAVKLLCRNYDFNSMPHLRTITVGTSGLISDEGGSFQDDSVAMQQSIFDEEHEENLQIKEKQAKLDVGIDKLRGKFGYDILKRGVAVGEIFTCDSREADDDFIPFSHD